jgi:hypothetical protein
MAKKLTKKQAKKLADKFKTKGNASSSCMFTKEAVMNIMNQPNCQGLRIYNGYDDDETNPQKKFTMFLVGTDANGTNLLPTGDESTTEQYSIEDDANPCPPSCPPNDL